MTENEKIELFDKWYDENYDEWAEGEEGIALREELEQAFKSGIAELEQENKVLAQNLEDTEIVNKALEKENAELKSENQKWKDEWQEQVQKATDEGYARTLQTIQLTKAKELLKQWLQTSKASGCDNINIVTNTEQFLKDN